jgi:hypothetical protein
LQDDNQVGAANMVQYGKKKEKCFLLSIQFETKREGYGSLEQGAVKEIKALEGDGIASED